MSNKFIFTELKDHDTAKIGDDWYKLDLINGQILYKIQCDLVEENSNMKLQPAKYNKEQKYEIYGYPQKYYIIRKNNKAGIIDENSNIIIDFKYRYLFDFYFYKTKKIYLAAVDLKNNLHGVIDINDKIIIPFMYDEIYIWNIDSENETLMVEKNKKCAIINIHNDIILDFKYKYIYGFGNKDHYSLAQIDNCMWGLIDRKGEPKELTIPKESRLGIPAQQ